MHVFRLTTLALVAAFAAVAVPVPPAMANNVVFGAARQNSDQPVEVASDGLSVNQKDGTATFTGNVMISQGAMILSAPSVLVVYKGESQKIDRLEASGGVTVVNGPDAAEAASATYNIDAGSILLQGNVLLTQGQNVMAGDRITIDLNAGTAQVGGRVRTTLQGEN